MYFSKKFLPPPLLLIGKKFRIIVGGDQFERSVQFATFKFATWFRKTGTTCAGMDKLHSHSKYLKHSGKKGAICAVTLN